PPRETHGWSWPRTSTGMSSGTACPAFSSRRSSEKTRPDMISAWARARLSARPRSTRSWSSRHFRVAIALSLPRRHDLAQQLLQHGVGEAPLLVRGHDEGAEAADHVALVVPYEVHAARPAEAGREAAGAGSRDHQRVDGYAVEHRRVARRLHRPSADVGSVAGDVDHAPRPPDVVGADQVRGIVDRAA